MAAKNTNRKWICIEKEEKYCEVSKKRIQELGEMKCQ
jgi:DNA modification methylase